MANAGGMPWWTGVPVFAAWWVLDVDPIRRILGLAILVGVPLAVTFTGDDHRWYRLVRAALVPAGLLGVAGLSLPAGPLAAGLTSAWLLECAGLALWGLLRFRMASPLAEKLMSLGLLYLPVGAGWLLASRAGVPLLGFHEPIVLLTAVHFHYAGCMAATLAGALGRALPNRAPYRIVATGVALGPPLVAVGITFSSRVEVVSGVLLGSCVLGLALLAFQARPPATVDRFALWLSSCCGIAAMLLAISYALRWSAPDSALPIPAMVLTHGLLNSVGFTTVGLWACRSWGRAG